MKFFNKIFSEKKEEYSKDYERFLNDYFTGDSMIRSRGEEDITVWKRLKGVELENAKQKILDILPNNEECFMRAAAIIRDERAIPKLKDTADKSDNVHSRCYAAKILYDWIGYENYFDRLNDIFESENQWSKTSLGFWINGLSETDALKYFWKAMNDIDSFVRYSAYGALENYFGIRKIRKDGKEIKYYTDEEVFQNKELFQKRQDELKNKIEEWKNN